MKPLTPLILALALTLSAHAAHAQAGAAREEGLTALRSGNYPAAVEALERHTRLSPTDQDALHALAEAYLMQNQLDLAQATLGAAHKVKPNQAQTRLLVGLLRFKQKDYDKAQAELAMVQKLKGENTTYYYYLAMLHVARNQKDLAQAALTQALAQKNLSDLDKASLWLLQWDLDPAKGEAALQVLKGLKLSGPLQERIATRQLEWLAATSQTQQIIDLYMDKLMESGKAPSPELATRTYSEMFKWLGRVADKTAYSSYLIEKMYAQYQMFADDAVTRQQLINEYKRTQQTEFLKALLQQDLLTSAALTPIERGQLMRELADVNLQLGEIDFAFNNYERAHQLNPGDLYALTRMGVLYMVAKRFSKAIESLDKVVQARPLDHEARLYLAWAHAFNRDAEKATRMLEALPAGSYPEQRAWLNTLLSYSKEQPMPELPKLLIPAR
jgi:tetratricopeptide (TPR) repeat protein